MANCARIERKRYWTEGGRWFRETSIFVEDTQSIDRAWVNEVTVDDVPENLRAFPPEADDAGVSLVNPPNWTSPPEHP